MNIDTVWQNIQEKHINQRLAHAQLFCGDDEAGIAELVTRLTNLQLCQLGRACGQCQSCHLLISSIHPDVNYLRAEKQGGAIKVDQIRAIQPWVYTSAQLSKRRLIVIAGAEKMNNAATNALLKMLEEPPSNVYFILLASHLNTIAATIVSRCQLWRLYTDANADYFHNSERYITDPGQIFTDLQQFLSQKESVCSLAARWAQHDFHKLLIFLYLLHAQLIKSKLLNYSDKQLDTLSKQVKLPLLFKQLDKINGIFKNLNHTISVNPVLALENLLLGYLE